MARSSLAAAALLLPIVLVSARAVAAPAEIAAPASGTPPRIEFGVVPVLGGDSDVGLTFGIAGALTRIEDGYAPYRWRVDAAAITSVQPASNTVTHQDYHLGIALPDLANGWLRVDTRVGFSRFVNGEYHGLGNDASAPSSSREFGLIYPEWQLAARVLVWNGLALLGGATYRYVWPEVSPDGTLAAHLADPTPLERKLLVGTDEHAVMSFTTGVVWDTRDNDVSPTRGSFASLLIELSPALGGASRYSFGGGNLTAERYEQLGSERLILATRIVIDAIAGSAPFYELARLRDETPAPGGGQAVRGVPAYRYFGKDKVIGNLELRGSTRPFEVFGQSVRLGAVGFVDTGRVFADVLQEPPTPGGGIGLKVGLGGGVRLYWGRGFVLRGDLAWSPDARPVAFYFNVNEAF